MSEPRPPVLPALEVLDEGTRIQQIHLARRQAEQEGYAAGLAQAQAEAALVLQALRGAEQQRQDHLQAVSRQLEVEAVELALLCAEQLVLGGPLDREALLATVQGVLDYVREAEQVFLYLHPEDLLVAEQLLAQDPRLHLQADPELGRGSVRVESQIGNLEADRSTRLDALRQALQAHLEERLADGSIA